MSKGITDILESAQLARLIPTVADTKKEERATASLLASFMVVPLFAREILASVGAPVGKTIKIKCYTEVIFKSKRTNKSQRPDGLIFIKMGKRTWSAIVESKIGNADLNKEQVESYLDVAKKHGVNAVITISNQFATTPSHHPVKVSKTKTRSVELYHFSWLALKSKAVLLTANQSINDPEQAYILSELVRYLDHDSSGVSSLSKMSSNWKEACNVIQQNTKLNKSSQVVKDAVSSWHQLLRHLALQLSMEIGEPVTQNLSRTRMKNADLNFVEDCSYLSIENSLYAEFDIPNAASPLIFVADLARKTISVSMKLGAPKDKSMATASINWLTRQLRDKNIERLLIRAYWPGRIPMTGKPIEEVIEDPKVLLPSGVSVMPTTFEVIRIIDLGKGFKGMCIFVKESSKEFSMFYDDVGQHLYKWVAKAPKVKEKKPEEPSIPTIFSIYDQVLPADNNGLNIK